MSSRAGHVTTETVFGPMLALRLGNGDEHHPLESDTTRLNVKENLYLYAHKSVSKTIKVKVPVDTILPGWGSY